jgi:hypothetical protein
MRSSEVFEYGGDGIVRLLRIQLLCKRCHDCKHFDHLLRMENSGSREKGRSELIIEHFCRLNACSNAAFEQHFAASERVRWELERKYGPAVPEDRVHYGPYNEQIALARKRRRQWHPNWWQALQTAIKYAVGHGLHPDYRDEIIELVRDDLPIRESLLRCIQKGDFDGAYTLIKEILEESRDDWDPLPDGELYGHR